MTRKEFTESYEYRFIGAEIANMNLFFPSDSLRREREGFAKGVEWCREWMENNPNWHKYPEEKPKVDDDYIVYLDAPGFCPTIEIYDYSEEDEEFGYFHMSGEGKKVKWVSIDDYVKTWMEKPESPKFD